VVLNKKVKVCGLLHLKTDENRVFDAGWARFGHIKMGFL